MIRNQGVSKDMVRPKHEPLIRLSRRIWIRALIRDVDKRAMEHCSSADISWAELGRRLLRVSQYPLYVDLLFKGILGVVNEGNNPRRIVRRIDVDDTDGSVPEGLSVVMRQPSGPAANDARPTRYIELPVDLVECGKDLCPGSEQWETAYLWRVAEPRLPSLEELRMVISRLTIRLGMHTPSFDEYRPYLSIEEFSELEELPEAEVESRYRHSLEPFIAAQSADAMSLLAALVAESFMTDQELMMNIHRDAFKQASELLLADKYFKDVEEDFSNLVTARILVMNWQMPAACHISSINSPFITMNRWKEITGIDDWIPIWDP